jgi:hypothetical protein
MAMPLASAIAAMLATHTAHPDTIAACSHYGELFTSHDSGASWQKVQREFSEIRALALLPN